ncbi:MAG: VWA domain-containing protein [Saprospiraceae bacterium]|nr:VWA domain-containing protein [Saprospiraceae bacterium]
MTETAALTWQQPLWLLLLLLLPLLWWWPGASRPPATMRWPEALSRSTWRTRMLAALPWLRATALALCIIALARPQLPLENQMISSKGIDIGLVLDVSESMLAEDFAPNRLEAGKRVALHFVNRRPADRFSVTLFAGEAFSPCPLTSDHNMVKEIIAGIQYGILRDNTAIGDGLATAVNRLKDSPAKSKVIILLTDGDNNAGYIQPQTAAEITQSLGIRLYTIGMSGQLSFFPGATGPAVNETLLREMAEKTGGRYFRAEDSAGLERVYAEIDRLEKTETENAVVRRAADKFYVLIWAALLFIAAEWLLRFAVLRVLP